LCGSRSPGLSDLPNRSAWRSNEAAMNESHLAYLSLGSNIEPTIHLVEAVKMLDKVGKVQKVSNAWESRSVGTAGPNYLNACVSFVSPFMPFELKEQIIRPIEAQLGRKRSENKYVPRTIDIDIVLFDDNPYNDKFWKFAFIIVPLAEIYPDYQNPLTQEKITETATRLRQEVWIESRPNVLSQFNRKIDNVQN
jgi:2-amino-4-hydroxy-6-hydroxymethyldihydropteridine diphosphokinase